MHGLASVKKG